MAFFTLDTQQRLLPLSGRLWSFFRRIINLAIVLLSFYSCFSYSHNFTQDASAGFLWYCPNTSALGHGHRYTIDSKPNPAKCYYVDITPGPEDQCPPNEQKVTLNNEDFVCESAVPPLGVSVNNGQSSECPRPYTRHPIHIATGSKYFSKAVFMGQGVNPLQFRFSYNSNVSHRAWTASYQQVLTINESAIIATRADGQTLYFSVSDSVISGQAQRSEVLSLNGDVYTLLLPGNTVETYSSSGQLLAIRYPGGTTHELSYSNNDNTVTVTHNNKTLVIHKTLSLISSIVLPDGGIVTVAWDTSGDIDRLTTVTHPDGTTRTYLYENIDFPHYITGIIDENGHRISSVAYDDEGRAISSERGELGSGINRTEIEYHNDGTRTVTNSLGKQNIYHFTDFNGEYKMTRVEGQPSANCAAANQAYTYDDNGFMASKTDWKGNVTTYTHNDRGLETSRTEASGTPQARTITTQWHDTFNLRTQIIHPDTITSFTYDSSGRLLSKEVSPR